MIYASLDPATDRHDGIKRRNQINPVNDYLVTLREDWHILDHEGALQSVRGSIEHLSTMVTDEGDYAEDTDDLFGDLTLSEMRHAYKVMRRLEWHLAAGERV